MPFTWGGEPESTFIATFTGGEGWGLVWDVRNVTTLMDQNIWKGKSHRQKGHITHSARIRSEVDRSIIKAKKVQSACNSPNLTQDDVQTHSGRHDYFMCVHDVVKLSL